MSKKPAESLKNKLLIKTPDLDDSIFSKSVAYIFEDNDNGSMGIVINKPMEITLASILEHLEIPADNPDFNNYPVLRGGPVAPEHGFIIHREKILGQGLLTDPANNLIISASKQDLITFPQASFSNMLITLGYAGWSKGQLWDEIKENSWLVAPLDIKILFEVPYEDRWNAAAASIGLEFSRFVSEAGHA
ncbi:MAG: YqgE/AlgH family protein [Gammaproteobacteria bacterium]|nr:YqgE/AlgH family protein [Gammaproteobacteria bacterium]